MLSENVMQLTPKRSSEVLATCFSVVAFACTPSPQTSAQAVFPDEPASIGAASIEMTGRVRSHSDERLPATHLTVHRGNFVEPIFDNELGSSGQFRVAVPGPGVYFLRFAGVSHAETHLSVAIDGPLRINANLGTYPRAVDPEQIFVRLRWIDIEGNTGEEREVEAVGIAGSHERYLLRLNAPPEARSLQYQVVDSGTGRSSNGPVGPGWSYDGEGDYWSEQVWDGDEELEINLGLLPPPEIAPVLEMHGERFVVSRQEEAWRVLEPYRRRLHDITDPKLLGLSEGRAKIRRIALDARDAIGTVDDAELRVAVALEWAWFFGQRGATCLTGEEVAQVLALVSPEDPAWAFVSATVDKIFSPFPDDSALQEYRRRLAAAQHDPGLRAHLLYLDLVEANERLDSIAVSKLYNTLVTEFAGTVPVRWARTRFDPARPLQAGLIMPRWQFEGLHHEIVASDELRGRPYLLSVWATWCAPCVADMRAVHAAYDALGGSKSSVTFVSLSLDEAVTDVTTFRREQWPMPWLHAHVPPSDQQDLLRSWAFSGIPLVVFVDENGMIVWVHGTHDTDDFVLKLQGLAEWN